MKSVSPETCAFRKEIAKYIPQADAERITHVVTSGRGGVYTDLDGREYLDFSSGVLTNSFAHGDKELTRIFYNTYSSLANIHGRQWAGVMDFYRRLFPFLPSPDYRAVPYGDGGGYTVDRAEVELYYHFGKRRYRLATFQSGFHGKTQGTKMSLNQEESSAYFQAFSLPPPYCYRCPCGQMRKYCHMECAAAAEYRLAQCGAEAFLFEPILGGAIIVPPDGYWERLQDFCRKNKVLMIADEVLTGGGRSGSVIAGSAWKLEPDVILLSKGLANGLPLSLMLLKKKVDGKPLCPERIALFLHLYGRSRVDGCRGQGARKVGARPYSGKRPATGGAASSRSGEIAAGISRCSWGRAERGTDGRHRVCEGGRQDPRRDYGTIRVPCSRAKRAGADSHRTYCENCPGTERHGCGNKPRYGTPAKEHGGGIAITWTNRFFASDTTLHIPAT